MRAFRGPTQTGLYSQEEEGLYYPCSENKTLISFAVTAKLICAFVFAYANYWFSHVAALTFVMRAKYV